MKNMRFTFFSAAAVAAILATQQSMVQAIEIDRVNYDFAQVMGMPSYFDQPDEEDQLA